MAAKKGSTKRTTASRQPSRRDVLAAVNVLEAQLEREARAREAAPPKQEQQWHNGFDELADAQELFRAVNELAQEMRNYTDFDGIPTQMALEAVAEKGLRSLTTAWSAFAAIKDGRPMEKAEARHG